MWEREQRAQQAPQSYAQRSEAQNLVINRVDPAAVNAYVAKVFGWMFIGLMVTAFTTVGIVWGIYNSAAFAGAVDSMMGMFFVVMIAQLVLVWTISGRVTRMNPTTSKVLFILYAAMNGLTFGFVVLVFAFQVFAAPMVTIGMTFGITALAFGIMAVYGLMTNSDLTRFGNLLFMGLIGLIIASIANVLLIGSFGLDFIIIIFGLFLFMGLTAYHTHTIKHHYAQIALADNSAEAMGAPIDQEALASNLAITGALSLYLSFINMFMFILRLLARRN